LKIISLLHPFSAKAIGLLEKDLFFSHSKPHEKALLALQDKGFTVSMDYFTGRLFPFTKRIHGINKRFWPITKPLVKKRHGWRKQHSLFHYWSCFLNAPDVTIINMSGHGSPYCFKLAKMLVKKGKPYIAMVGGLHMSTHQQAAEYYRQAHHLIVHTEVQKKELQKIPLFKTLSIQVMPLGVDTSVFKPKEKRPNTVNLLFVGRISRLKQIELAIETLAFLIEKQETEATLTIVGPVSDRVYFTELNTLASQLHVQEHVTFTGTIEQEHLVPYYQRANLLVLPSAHESFGMVMVEAMACGTPVAALQGAGGPDEIIDDNVNGILTQKALFAERILQHMQSSESQRQLEKNARLIVKDKWSMLQTENALRTSINQVFR
tara:strand:- start:5172 stop:6302 length:1131 start_codon:yes stop_codon:yes gene_type:complete